MKVVVIDDGCTLSYLFEDALIARGFDDIVCFEIREFPIEFEQEDSGIDDIEIADIIIVIDKNSLKLSVRQNLHLYIRTLAPSTPIIWISGDSDLKMKFLQLDSNVIRLDEESYKNSFEELMRILHSSADLKS